MLFPSTYRSVFHAPQIGDLVFVQERTKFVWGMISKVETNTSSFLFRFRWFLGQPIKVWMNIPETGERVFLRHYSDASRTDLLWSAKDEHYLSRNVRHPFDFLVDLKSFFKTIRNDHPAENEYWRKLRRLAS